MDKDEIIRSQLGRGQLVALARESCPYTKELLRGAYYDGFMKAAALVAAEREVCLDCYSPDDTETDWADKIRGRNDK